jgi:hypothetical protein
MQCPRKRRNAKREVKQFLHCVYIALAGVFQRRIGGKDAGIHMDDQQPKNQIR